MAHGEGKAARVKIGPGLSVYSLKKRDNATETYSLLIIKKKNYLGIILLLFFTVISISTTGTAQNNTFNVTNFGAKGDGLADDTQAFLQAWKAVCGATGNTSTLEIPNNKTFLVKILELEGPCKSSSVHIQVSGKIVAPSTVSAWGACEADCWLCFKGINGLVMNGSGLIDGQGSAWWDKTKCNRPRALYYENCTDLKISGLSFFNSPKAHIVINSCNGVIVHNINITAPGESPNTDGIDLSKSTQVNIFDSFIGTGDDCVAINGGCSNINVTNIACGPGHGISIGSLGDSETDDNVEEVHVKQCSFTSTQNGARIKTQPVNSLINDTYMPFVLLDNLSSTIFINQFNLQGGTGFARNISYENITFVDTSNPIIIDQHYCNGKHCTEKAKAVVASDITFTNMHGTSKSKLAIKLDCDSKIGCNNIRLEDVGITSSDPAKQVTAFCNNVRGESVSTVMPPVPCLSETRSIFWKIINLLRYLPSHIHPY